MLFVETKNQVKTTAKFDITVKPLQRKILQKLNHVASKEIERKFY